MACFVSGWNHNQNLECQGGNEIAKYVLIFQKFGLLNATQTISNLTD